LFRENRIESLENMVLLQVELDCGSKEEVSDVVEPNRCEYQARMTTPAACSPEEAKSLQVQIAGVEQELAAKDEL
jgi:protein kinase C substrate 80K-H